MHDFYVNQLHHHSPHATMHTIHAIYFFLGSRGPGDHEERRVWHTARIKRSSKPFPFFSSSLIFAETAFKSSQKNIRQRHIFLRARPHLRLCISGKWDWCRLFLSIFFQMHNFRFWKCSADNSIAHPHPTFSSRASFFFKGRQHAISRLFKYH